MQQQLTETKGLLAEYGLSPPPAPGLLWRSSLFLEVGKSFKRKDFPDQQKLLAVVYFASRNRTHQPTPSPPHQDALSTLCSDGQAAPSQLSQQPYSLSWPQLMLLKLPESCVPLSGSLCSYHSLSQEPCDRPGWGVGEGVRPQEDRSLKPAPAQGLTSCSVDV